MSGQRIKIPPINKLNAHILKNKGFKVEGEYLILPKPTWSSETKTTHYENAWMGFPATLTTIEIFNYKKKPYLTISSYQDADYYDGAKYTFH